MRDYTWTGYDLDGSVFQVWYSTSMGWMCSENSTLIEHVRIDKDFIWYKLVEDDKLKRPYNLFEDKGAAELECQLRNKTNITPEDLIEKNTPQALKLANPENE